MSKSADSRSARSPRTCGPHAAKRPSILAAGREVFLEMGYERACVDVIAARAGVSKATVYNHFEDKGALFLESFSVGADDIRTEFLASLGEPKGQLETALRGVGQKLTEITLAPTFVSLYRHTSAESSRFPELGRMLFERGPVVVQQKLGAYLKRWEEKGKLDVRGDERLAAVHFIWLCHGDLYVRAQLGAIEPSDAPAIRRTVNEGVKAFIRAYAPSGG